MPHPPARASYEVDKVKIINGRAAQCDGYHNRIVAGKELAPRGIWPEARAASAQPS